MDARIRQRTALFNICRKNIRASLRAFRETEIENSLNSRSNGGCATRWKKQCRKAADATQVLVTTHSPFFLNALKQEEVRVLWRDEQGYTQCSALQENSRIKHFVDAGAGLGDLWMEGYFGVGDPLTAGGMSSLASCR